MKNGKSFKDILKMFTKLERLLLFATFILVIAITISVVYIKLDKKLEANQEPEIVVLDIQGKINDIGELASADYNFRMIKLSEKPSKTFAGLDIPFTKSKIIYSYDGEIKAGVDFMEIEIIVNEAKKTVFVDLPDAEILSSELDNDSLIIYDEKNNPLNIFTLTDLNEDQNNLKKSAEDSAISHGLLLKAYENAKSMIKVMIESFYDTEEYSIEFY